MKFFLEWGKVLNENEESQMTPINVTGRSAWKALRRLDKPTYLYFLLKVPAFRNGNQPEVQVSITYLDRGTTTVAVEYDSSDKRVNATHPKGAGVFKEATRFKVKQSDVWKTVVFNLNDANFAGRCNGSDLRLGFMRPDVDPVVAEVMVKPIR